MLSINCLTVMVYINRALWYFVIGKPPPVDVYLKIIHPHPENPAGPRLPDCKHILCKCMQCVVYKYVIIHIIWLFKLQALTIYHYLPAIYITYNTQLYCAIIWCQYNVQVAIWLAHFRIRILFDLQGAGVDRCNLYAVIYWIPTRLQFNTISYYSA